MISSLIFLILQITEKVNTETLSSLLKYLPVCVAEIIATLIIAKWSEK
jgi:hypothetical protein